MATVPPVPPTGLASPILETHGPGLVGVFLNVMLFGTQIVQTFTYFETYLNDPLWMKFFVGILFLADALNTLFSAGWIFRLMILEFSNIQAYINADWLLSADPAMGGIIAAACQMFFAWRICILARNYWIGAFIAALSVCVAVGGISIGVGLGKRPDLTNIDHFRALVYLWLLPGLVADVLITVTMTYFLRKRSTGFKQTETILKKVLRLTIQNSLITTMCAAGDLISYLTTPKGYHIGFSFPIPKLYSNAVMTSLNSRSKLKNLASDWENTDPTGSSSVHDVENRGGNIHSFGGRSRSRGPAQEVYNLSTPASQPKQGVFIGVETSTVTHSDSKSPPGIGHGY